MKIRMTFQRTETIWVSGREQYNRKILALDVEGNMFLKKEAKVWALYMQDTLKQFPPVRYFYFSYPVAREAFKIILDDGAIIEA